MTNIYGRLILIIWIVFLVYWAASAIRAKRNVGPRIRWGTQAAIRLTLLVLVLVVVRIPVAYRWLKIAQDHVPGSMPARLGGVVLCALGIGLAIWARAYLGRNWGMPMSRKENPELVTTGPYAFIRHPIYTGVLTALFGSAMSTSIIYLVAFFAFGVYFTYSARQEEKLKCEEFPEQYAAYMKRTSMLVPFVL